jgi:hypothetical protein
VPSAAKAPEAQLSWLQGEEAVDVVPSRSRRALLWDAASFEKGPPAAPIAEESFEVIVAASAGEPSPPRKPNAVGDCCPVATVVLRPLHGDELLPLNQAHKIQINPGI